MESKELTIEERRKAAIKGAGYTLDKAAEKLKISRTTLYAQLSKVDLSDDFVQNVKAKLGVDLGVSSADGKRKIFDASNGIKDSEEIPEMDLSDPQNYRTWVEMQLKAGKVTLLDDIAVRMIAHTVSDLFISTKNINFDKNRKERIRVGLEDAKEYLQYRMYG